MGSEAGQGGVIAGLFCQAGPMSHRPSLRASGSADFRRRLAALTPLAALALSACGPSPAWRVRQLPPSPVPPQRPEVLRRCAAALASKGLLQPEQATPADPSNHGERQRRDVHGRDVPHGPQLIVLHETVISEADTLKLFRTPHPRDKDQASYHLLVSPTGERLRLVADEQRAYGAGMSAWGDMSVRIRPTSPGSINNVALHLSLVTPPDGRGDTPAHSGYTSAQYTTAAAQVLLWQARWGIPLNRLTTHAAVDRSRTRVDPRSFRWARFERAWREAATTCGLSVYDTGLAGL
ncbi:MAG: peptidoglycan recognition family protein [Cyanobacteriota bacterium]|nr:peptidoglycan recognition family protein [Cyanobacteriota bacterium]